MKKLKHSKYRNTGILFELLVRKLTSETMTSDKSLTIDIIKKYFGQNTELAKELQLYNNLVKEQYKSEAYALEFIRNVKDAHTKLNQSVLNQILQCKTIIAENGLPANKNIIQKDVVLESYSNQSEDMRLLSYKLLIDKFNKKYGVLSESQKELLAQYITNVNDTDILKQYIGNSIPKIKNQLKEYSTTITDKITKIKVEKLSEMLCSVENKKIIKESHILSLLRYMDLVNELKQVNSWNHFYEK